MLSNPATYPKDNFHPNLSASTIHTAGEKGDKT